MNPLDAIAPVESVLNVAKQAVAPVAQPVHEALVQKFDALMKTGLENPVPRPDGMANSGPDSAGNVLSNVLSKQEAVLRDTSTEIDNFVSGAKNMSMSELMANNMDLSRKVTLSNVGLQSTVAVAQGSNKSLQSLLKNQ